DASGWTSDVGFQGITPARRDGCELVIPLPTGQDGGTKRSVAVSGVPKRDRHRGTARRDGAGGYKIRRQRGAARWNGARDTGAHSVLLGTRFTLPIFPRCPSSRFQLRHQWTSPSKVTPGSR